MNVKLNKLIPTLNSHIGEQKNFVIAAKQLTITINGEIHKFDDQYCFTKGSGKIFIDKEKSGSVLTWKGTHRKHVVKFMSGNSLLAEFEIPENAKLRLEDGA